MEGLDCLTSRSERRGMQIEAAFDLGDVRFEREEAAHPADPNDVAADTSAHRRDRDDGPRHCRLSLAT